MSPERLDPDHFGLEDSQPTKESDRYALGMVVLEVLSGRAPFASYDTHVVMRKVAKGERPGRPEGPEGAWFTDDLWQVLELCWSTPPERRPSIEAVLECLERVSVTWEPPSRQTGEGVGTDEDYLNDTTVSHYSVCFLAPVPFTPHSCSPRLWLSFRIHSIRPSIPFDRSSGRRPGKRSYCNGSLSNDTTTLLTKTPGQNHQVRGCVVYITAHTAIRWFIVVDFRLGVWILCLFHLPCLFHLFAYTTTSQ